MEGNERRATKDKIGEVKGQKRLQLEREKGHVLESSNESDALCDYPNNMCVHLSDSIIN